MLVHKQITIKGKVENTGFRFYALRGAYVYSINGFVSQKGGNIVIEAEGEPGAMDHFTEWCRQGTTFSHISGVEVINKEIYGYQNFQIH